MATLALIDYGSGNLRSAEKALRRAAETAAEPIEVRVVSAPEEILTADRLVLPGVGAFAACRDALASRPGLTEALHEAVRSRGRPFLGICVGMQLLADRGLEFGVTPGLGWIPGEVRRLEPDAPDVKVPHVGWNDLHIERPSAFFTGEPPAVYFTHSFKFVPEHPHDMIASADHGGRFAAALVRDNVAGVQFHPEKSQGAGLAFIRRFLDWRP